MTTFSRVVTAGAISFVCAAGLAAPSFAQGKGHGGGSATNSNSNGMNSLDRDFGTARAGDRMSTQGIANTNGFNSTDRDTGKARALDRQHK